MPSKFKIRLTTELFGVESEFLRFYAAELAYDHVEQNHSGILTCDPIRRPFEWRAAMFANPTHTQQLGKGPAASMQSRFLPLGEAILAYDSTKSE